MSEIISVNDGNFESHIQTGQTVIVDFWAPTCMPCRLMEPGLEKIAASHQMSSRYFVRTLPTLLFIKDGQVRTQIVGAVNPNQIEKTLSEVG
ncbi:MAG: thioredoxin family protein [Acidobacteria bacterium]|nr:thioredoxin family protein [Acidobacteriota bacterium]